MKIKKKQSIINQWKYAFLLICAGFLLSCSSSDDDGDGNGGGGETPTENTTVKITANKNRVLRNPLSGWVMYLGRDWSDSFWADQGYDNMYVPDIGKSVKVSDYANTCYLRTSWRSLEPEEGKYIWNDPNAQLSKLLKTVRDRGMRLAFRIVVDGRDQGQNTPLYVINAGADWYGSESQKSPYPDDKIFQEKYSKFIEAFAKRFDNADEVDFIDAYGLGKWGESHTMVYKNDANKKAVLEWATDLYTRCFKKVPLVINYHRLIGNSGEPWGAVAPDTEELLNIAIRKGYILRHDAFGMTDYYQDWEKQFAARWNFKLPIIMEGGWITGGGIHRYWVDGSGKYREGHPEDVRQGEFDASAEAKVNMMDFRVGDETYSWFNLSFSLVQRFISEGGYRLYPDMISLPKEVTSGQNIQIVHRWNNMGWGYCPTNIQQWNQKYKVAFALLDSQNSVKKVFVDTQTDLSKWMKGSPTTYEFDLSVKGVSAGAYTWAVGLVDTTKDNEIGLEMAVPEDDNLLNSGWVKVLSVVVK